MIQIESIHIEEIRGIRELTLTMNRENFVISGPNGSGKSGVVDAIQFALTGEISRLMGTGTGELKLAEHGPHVDKRSDPEAAFVKLDVFIPHLKKTASITRNFKKPKHPTITPDDAVVKAVFEQVAEHPEMTLSRREIIKFILSEASRRSRDVQTLLKLDDIDQTRATLKTTENKLGVASATAKAQQEAAEESLKRHLDLPRLRPEDVLAAVNKKRSLLSLPLIEELTKTTSLSDGISSGGAKTTASQTRESALRDLDALAEALNDLQEPTGSAVASALENTVKVENDPSLLELIQQRPFLESGFELIDGPYCPLCDAEWDIEALRAQVREKLKRTEEAQTMREELLESGRIISNEAIRIRTIIDSVRKISDAEKDFVDQLGEWSGNLLSFSVTLESVEGVIGSKARLESEWTARPPNLVEDLESTREKVKARPDESTAGEARDFLVVAQERFSTLRRAQRDVQEKEAAAVRGRIAYKTYCDISESALEKLYAEVEGEFGKYYRLINFDDEGKFKAKFEPAEGKLGLLVDFYQKGMFPPGAYHSEGHQDGMGVCLYFALTKRVLGNLFTLAVLDDVVMSVDSQHRKQFCKLLKTYFPDTQLVITTHDDVWARQMRSEGLVSSKSSIAFIGWSVDTGPILDEMTEVWDRIDSDLAKNDIPAAAARLRRHLEYAAKDLADEIGAKVSFRGDAGYDMGELLSAVIGRQGELLKRARRAAESWDDAKEKRAVAEIEKSRSEILTARGGEEWVINKAVHYNEWFNLSREEFKPVVKVFKELLNLFRCSKCDSWITLTPRQNPVEVRCLCGRFRLNLKEK